METSGGSELTDPTEGGDGQNEGASRANDHQGSKDPNGPVPQGGGAVGGPADPIAGDAGSDAKE
jgi:hypothetical protein